MMRISEKIYILKNLETLWSKKEGSPEIWIEITEEFGAHVHTHTQTLSE